MQRHPIDAGTTLRICAPIPDDFVALLAALGLVVPESEAAPCSSPATRSHKCAPSEDGRKLAFGGRPRSFDHAAVSPFEVSTTAKLEWEAEAPRFYLMSLGSSDSGGPSGASCPVACLFRYGGDDAPRMPATDWNRSSNGEAPASNDRRDRVQPLPPRRKYFRREGPGKHITLFGWKCVSTRRKYKGNSP